MTEMHQVFVALGGNIGDSEAIVRYARMAIKALKGVYHLRSSRIYQTTPVGPPQPDFMNAVCVFDTTIPPQELLGSLLEIEKGFGRGLGVKDGPRVIDLDILLYGTERVDEEKLQIPHPRWSERLFVLTPLMDLTDVVSVPDLKDGVRVVDLHEALEKFPNIHQEVVVPAGE